MSLLHIFSARSCNPYTALAKALQVMYFLAAKELQQTPISPPPRRPAAPGPSRLIMEGSLGRGTGAEVGRSVHRQAQAVDRNPADSGGWSGQGTGQLSLNLHLGHHLGSPSSEGALVPKTDQSIQLS